MKSELLLRRLLEVVLLLVIALVFIGLASTVLSLPPVAAGLADDVNAALGDSGIPNPVTATLLDFRSYDTLLEIAVLLLAATAIRSVGRGDLPTLRRTDEILALLGRVLVPVMILIAGYLLMSGFAAPGGAFQAGATLAAAGVLLILSGKAGPLPAHGSTARLALAIGLAAFVVAGVAGLLLVGAFLDYPAPYTGVVVLLLEISVSLSVALALLEMFVGALRRPVRGDAAGDER